MRDVPDLSAGTCFWSGFLPTCFAFDETLPSANRCSDEPTGRPSSSVSRLEEDCWKTILKISYDEELNRQKKWFKDCFITPTLRLGKGHKQLHVMKREGKTID